MNSIRGNRGPFFTKMFVGKIYGSFSTDQKKNEELLFKLVATEKPERELQVSVLKNYWVRYQTK